MQSIEKIDDTPGDANRMRLHPMRGLANKRARRVEELEVETDFHKVGNVQGFHGFPFSLGPLPVAFRHCFSRKRYLIPWGFLSMSW